MPGFVENVNTVALGLTPGFMQDVSAVASIQGVVSVVAADALSVVSVATNVVPNLAEILLADTNAAIATTKAGESSASAAAALASELSTANLLDQFDDRYLGNKALAPTLDNDGNVLLVGALYFDTALNMVRVWDGVLWGDALTLTAASISTLTNKTLDHISNTVGADHIHYKVRNESGSIIPVNTVVTASGTQPGTDYILVVPITDPQTQIALGIVHTTLAVNGTGLVINTGVADDVNTSTWTVGTILYPSTTGGLTTVKPTSGRYQACSIVLRQHVTQGTLLCEFTEPKSIASTTQEGYVQLNDTLTSTSTVQALTAAQGKVLQDGKQPIDPTLTALAGVVTAADQIIYATGVDTFATSSISVFGRSLMDDIDASAARTTLGAESAANKGAANGYAPLGADAKVPAANLPSYVDDVLEYVNLVALPVTGTSGIIYITTDTNRSYRWSGTAYVDITGMVDSVNGATGTVVLTATNIGSTAVGGIAATNVQAAIQELDSEKVNSIDLVGAIGNINSPLLDMPLKNSLVMKAGVGSATFTRASTATYIDRYGVLKTTAIDEPRFEKEGYLNEGASTNLLTYSEDFSNAIWAKESSTVTTNTTGTLDPYGTNLADKLVETATNGFHYTQQSLAITANTPHSVSIFLKAGERSLVRVESWNITDGSISVDINLSTGVANSAQSFLVTPAANGWYRISVTSTPTITGLSLRILFRNPANEIFEPYLGDGTSGIYIFGAQLESLPFASSYIPTVASAVTRSADALNVTRAGNMPNLEVNGEITLAIDINTKKFIDGRYYIGLYTTTSDRIGLMLRNTGALSIICQSTEQSKTINTVTTISTDINYRLIVTINNDSLKLYLNGVLEATVLNTSKNITSTQNSTNTLLRIGAHKFDDSSYAAYSYIKNVRIFDKSLTAQEVALA